MSTYIKSNFLRQSFVIFTGIPLLIWTLGNFPARSLLKESLSVITIMLFCQMIGLFFWSRINTIAVKDLKMSRMIEFHKIIGYTCVTGMLLHPVFLVVPRFFESGVAPDDAFMTIITTFNQGVVLGILAWCLLLMIGITSLVRNRLPIKYTAWRTFHGVLAILFAVVASWHVIDLGRHSNPAMSMLIIFLTVVGVLLLVKTYTSKMIQKTGEI